MHSADSHENRFIFSTVFRRFVLIIYVFPLVVNIISMVFRSFGTMHNLEVIFLSALSDKLMEFKKLKGYRSVAAFAKDVNIPVTTLYDVLKERTVNLSVDNSQKLADFMGISVDELYGKAEKLPEGFLPLPVTKKVPRLGVISCGDPINSEENFECYDDVPEHIACDFTLKCEGDSMIGARINDGDLVYIRQQSTVENGQIAAVLIDGTEKLLKRVYINDDSVILQAENPVYPPRVYSKEDMNRVSIIGRAVGFTSILR